MENTAITENPNENAVVGSEIRVSETYSIKSENIPEIQIKGVTYNCPFAHLFPPLTPNE